MTLSDPDDLEKIQGYLGPADALIYYALTSEEGVGLVVRKDTARTVALAASRDIEVATEALLDHEKHIDPAKVPELRALLVESLGLGADVKRVFLSPMGRLGYVPFSLLFPDREVVYVPSGTTYGLLLEERGKRGKRVLGLGDPDYKTKVDAVAVKLRAGNATKLPPLPATKEEVEAVADVRLLDKQATEAGFGRRLAPRTDGAPCTSRVTASSIPSGPCSRRWLSRQTLRTTASSRRSRSSV